MPQRSSDLVETYFARALGAGILGGVFVVLAAVMFAFRGDSGLPLAVVLALLAIGLLVFAAVALAQSRRVGSYKMACPMCGATNGFEAAPTSDVVCRGCHRTIPIENGKLLSLKQVSCNFCHESNWYSDRTKSLICEACGREILIARPDGSVGAAQYAVQDDARPYEAVLIAFEHGTDGLIDAIQRALGTNRSQVRDLMTNLPSVLLTNVPRQKAEMLRNELSHHGAAVEARPVGG
jgi:ribosomal protein S27E